MKSEFEHIRDSYIFYNEMEKATKEVSDTEAVRNNDATAITQNIGRRRRFQANDTNLK